jgi:V8-like Glu-specific endopeptidase
MARLTCLVALLSLTGCSLSDPVMPGALARQQRPIIGGNLDIGDPAVVLLIMENQAGQGAFCTGEVVSPHVVLTAAHCLDPRVTGGSNFSYYVFLGYDYNDNSQQTYANYVDVREVHYHPNFDYNDIGAGYDVGVVITQSPIPVNPLKMNHASMGSSSNGKGVRFVGYGVTSGSDTSGASAGVKRQVSSTLTQVQSNLLYFSDAYHGTCQGDSGGPAFMNLGQGDVIVGLTSFGIGENCAGDSYSTRVDLYASSFVDPYIAQFDPGGNLYDWAQWSRDQASPRDAAIPRRDSAQGGTDQAIAAGELGAYCEGHEQCHSGVCAANDTGMFCTEPCDPSGTDSCPDTMRCGIIDGENFCVPKSKTGTSSCSLVQGPVSSPSLAMILTGVGLVGILVRRRRRGAA